MMERQDAQRKVSSHRDPAAKMILRHMNEQRAVESRTVRAGDGRSRNVVIRDQFIIEDRKHCFFCCRRVLAILILDL